MASMTALSKGQTLAQRITQEYQELKQLEQ